MIVWRLVMPLAIVLMLLEVDITQAFTGAGSVFTAFWTGAMGTVLGTLVAFAAFGRFLGPDGWKIGACLCSTYIGGSLKYAATAQALGMNSASLLAAGMAIDNLATAAYFGVIMMLQAKTASSTNSSERGSGISQAQAPTVESLSTALAASAATVVVGDWIASLLPPAFSGAGLGVMAVIASLMAALVSALTKRAGGKSGSSSVSAFAGAGILGGALMLLIFAVIGATAGLKEALAAGWPLLAYIGTTLTVHLAVVLAFGRLLKFPLPAVLIASNANIGGPATAAAMATARGWSNLIRPAVLTGTLGYTIGTAVACIVGVRCLKPMSQIYIEHLRLQVRIGGTCLGAASIWTAYISPSQLLSSH
eukprot:SM000321S12204  [mRNA]  locus=s321:62125:66629:- [translate_table: standard]